MTEKELLQQKNNHILKLEKEIEKWKRAVKKERYGLVWLDVPEGFEDDYENKLPILEEVPQKAIIGDKVRQTHILIEGDNYHALTCLNYTHKGKVDVIYIDPPYNTGQDGFRYKDKRLLDKYPDGTEVPKDHPFRHSYWLSFMKKRLELAKDILADDGLIFISIDDNESSQLRFLCDEIFGQSNFLLPLYVQVRYAGKTLVEDMDVQKLIETVYVYGKTSLAKLNREEVDYSFEKFIYKIEENGEPEMVTLGGKKVGIFRKEQYKIVEVESSKDALKEIWATGKVLDGNSSGRFFRDYLIPRQKEDELCTLYKVYGIGDDIYDYRYFTGPKKITASKGKYYQGVPKEIFDNSEGKTKTLPVINFVNFADAFGNCRHEGDVDFRSGKKPLEFLKYLLKLGIKPNKQNVVVDFFAGSGSTLEAVMDLQQNHKVILVTNNEGKIMDNICLPRMKNAINGYKNKQGSQENVKYYKTAFVGKHNILDADDKDKIQLAYHAGEMLAIAEDTLEQVEKNDYWQVFGNKDRVTAVYFREEQDRYDEFVKKVLSFKKPVTVYMFGWEEKVDVIDFEDSKNISLKTIPQPILEIYKQIYNII
jgi:adenine-specific DNA-methyltransferase